MKGEREQSRIIVLQIDNLRAIIRVKRTDGMQFDRINNLGGVCKRVLEIMNENIMRWYGHIKIKRVNKNRFQGGCLRVN